MIPSDKCPCKGCEDRHQGCHGSCEGYKGWKRLVEEDKEAKIKSKFIDGAYAEGVKRVRSMYRKSKK